MKERIFHQVPYHRLEDFLRCGWMVSIPNGPMHHHAYGLLVEWVCDCKMVRPR